MVVGGEQLARASCETPGWENVPLRKPHQSLTFAPLLVGAVGGSQNHRPV